MKKLYPYISLIIIATAIILPLRIIYFTAPILLIALFFFDKPVLNRLKKIYFWLFLFFLTFVQPLIFGTKNSTAWGISYSSTYLDVGLSMSMRALMIMSAFSFFIYHSKNLQFKKFWHKLGLDNFDEMFLASQKAKPAIIAAARGSLNSFKIRNNNIKRIFFIVVHPVDFFARLLSVVLKAAQGTMIEETEPEKPNINDE